MSHGNPLPSGIVPTDLTNPTSRSSSTENVTMISKYDEPLFGSSSPELSDIRQGSLGDCFFLAALGAVIRWPKGAAFLKSHMWEQGRDPLKPKNAENPAYVTVLLYDSGGTQRYVRVRKSIPILTSSISSQSSSAQPVYSQGALWVGILEKAMTAFSSTGVFQPASPSYDIIHGGIAGQALEILLGCEAEDTVIVDFSIQSNRVSTMSQDGVTYNEKAKLFFDTAMAPNVTRDKAWEDKIRPLTGFGLNAFKAWCSAATNMKTHCQLFKEEVLDRSRKLVRLEDVEAFFKKYNLAQTPQDNLMKWLRDNQVLSGKRFTHKYTAFEQMIFQKLETACNECRPAVVNTRDFIGTPSGFGHSASEPKVKGLVAKHSYIVLETRHVPQSGSREVKIRNPWSEYGRKYVTDIKMNVHAVANEPKAEFDGFINPMAGAEFWVPLADITRRFSWVFISSKSFI